ncbi:MAG: hypothetical protein ACKOAO_01385 [Oxalobacteraceae bacterium]
MALNSGSRTSLISKTPEKTGSPLSKLRKALTNVTKPDEKAKKDKNPSIKNREKTSQLLWSPNNKESSDTAAASSSAPSMPGLTSDTRFPPLASSYATPPTPTDWRLPLSAQASLTGATVSTTTTTSQQFPPTANPHASAATSVYPYPPVQFTPGVSPRPIEPSSPRLPEKTVSVSTNSSDSKQAQDTEATSSDTTSDSSSEEQARELFSALQKNVEHLLWHPSPSAYQQLSETMEQIKGSGLDFEVIDASSLVLRILVDPGKENLDPLIAWIAQLGCQLVSEARKTGLERSSVLERAVERGWPKTTAAIAASLREENSLREHTRNMLIRAMQSDKPISLLEKALRFSSDHCVLEAGITTKMIVSLSKSWQSDPENDLHREKFVALFETAQQQNQHIIPIATLLQTATKFHHAPMALTMLQLNANTEYLDENGKTVTDLALEGQQALIEKINVLRAKKDDIDPASHHAQMDECLNNLRSNQRIIDALIALESKRSNSSSE